MTDMDALIARERWGWCMGKKHHLLGRIVPFGIGQSYTARCRSHYCPLYLDPAEETPGIADCCRHCLRLLQKEADRAG